MSASTLRRSLTYLNPDENFVLHGRSTPYWEKAPYLSNSKITNTSTRLSQHTYFDPDKYRDRHYVKSLGDLASNLQELSSHFKHRLDKNVSFGDRLSSKKLDESFHTGAKLANSRNSKLLFSGKALGEDESQWFRRQSSHHPGGHIQSSLDFVRQPQHPVNHSSTGEGELYTPQECNDYPLSTSDSLCLSYFPVTMSAPFELSFTDANVDASDKKHSIRPKSAAVKMKSEYKMKERSGIDKEYFMTSEAPTTEMAAGMITSPYQCELARLRMERLRIEEDRLLELKRHEELERIRGPKEKWYESTGPDFHYESHKNTEMIKRDQQWEDMLKYRDSLQRSSLELQKSYHAIS